MSSSATSPPRTPDSALSIRPKRVLLVMINHHLGDFVLSMPTLQALVRSFDCETDLVVDQCHAGLAGHISGVSRILVHDQAHRRGSLMRRAHRFLALWSDLRRDRYDLVLDVGGGIQSVTLTLLTGARNRVGLGRRRRSWTYSIALTTGDVTHQTDLYAPFLRFVGQERAPRLELSPTERESADAEAELRLRFGYVPERLAVIHPGAGYAFRKWPADRFIRVANELVRRWNFSVALIGAPFEEAILREMASACAEPGCVRPFARSVPTLLALFDRARILIANESGPTHLAAATRIPIVTIFGPTDEARWRPLREADVSILRGRACEPDCRWGRCVCDYACIRELTAERVLEACANHLDR